MRSVDLFNRIGADQSDSRGDSSDFTGEYHFFATGGNDIWTAAALVGPTQRIPGFQYRPSTRSANYQYQNSSYFDAFGLSTPAGTWTLTISDHAAGSTGQITGWRLMPWIPAPNTTAMLALPAAIAALRNRRGCAA